MSIRDNLNEFQAAMNEAHKEFPKWEKTKYTPQNCPCHDFSFIIYCDSGEWDIARCRKCGKEIVVPCHFDDDYD